MSTNLVQNETRLQREIDRGSQSDLTQEMGSTVPLQERGAAQLPSIQLTNSLNTLSRSMENILIYMLNAHIGFSFLLHVIFKLIISYFSKVPHFIIFSYL